MAKKIMQGQEFFATLTASEMQWVSERVVDNQVNNRVKEMILSGELVTPVIKEAIIEEEKRKFSKNGNKRLLKILKDEFKGVDIKMGINIAGKQKNLSILSDKILAIFQFILSNPQGFQQVMQMEGMGSAFNDILEFSGVSAVDFTNLATIPQPQEQQQAGQIAVPQSLSAQPKQNA